MMRHAERARRCVGAEQEAVWDYAVVNTLRQGRLDELAIHSTAKLMMLVESEMAIGEQIGKLPSL